MSALTSQPDTDRETPRVRLHLDGWHDRPSAIETIERIRRRLQQGVPVDGIFDDLEMALGPDGNPGRDDIDTLITDLPARVAVARQGGNELALAGAGRAGGHSQQSCHRGADNLLLALVEGACGHDDDVTVLRVGVLGAFL
ncbi:hypothetical protein [Streptomyces sp. NPDC058441]|uniref:hypothetical protein n=1 Tax=Streptomyces sp. NPDC058441 TaxID=3346502 RepID=UPI0036530B57